MYTSEERQQQQHLNNTNTQTTPGLSTTVQVLLREVRDHAPALGDPRSPEGGLRGGPPVVPRLLLQGLRELGVVLPLPLRAHDLGPGEAGGI